MRRIAIFVEGQSELIFTREFLLKWYEYVIDIECRRLLTDDNLGYVDYDFPNSIASIHVQIIDAGGDNKILSRILNREQYLINAGYELIIGLRDMYSEAYQERVKSRIVDLAVNNQFRQGIKTTIQQRAKYPNSIRFCFAIMEIESWWLGIPSLWSDLDLNVIQKYQSSLNSPETVFHPASMINKLLQTKGEVYSKRKSEVESIVGRLSREHYAELHDSQRAPSFCEFVQYVQF